MAREIKVKKIGMSVAPIALVEWRAKEGDPVREGEVVLVVETEKIRHDITARGSGFLHILARENGSASPGTVVGFIAETREELASLQRETPAVSREMPAEAETAREAPITGVEESPGKKTGGVLISPLARRLAGEHMVDITKVRGTGPDGRIVREDIEREMAARGRQETTPPSTVSAPAGETFQVWQGRRVRSVQPLVGMRKAIAEHMHRSLQVSAQLTGIGEIDVTELVKWREMLTSRESEIGTRITYTDLLVFVVAKVLGDYPMVNAAIIDNEIKIWEDINIGVAVSTEGGLIVPVVRDAGKKSLVEISQAIKNLAQRARERTLERDDIQGGTFTISNLGARVGGWHFDTLIINQPESAILGTGGISERAVVRNGEIVARPILTYSFTYDHRLIDGVLAGEFMAGVVATLENPSSLRKQIP